MSRLRAFAAWGGPFSDMHTNTNFPVNPPPGMEVITNGIVMEGDWFRFPAMPVWAPCPPSSIGEKIVFGIVARIITQKKEVKNEL